MERARFSFCFCSQPVISVYLIYQFTLTSYLLSLCYLLVSANGLHDPISEALQNRDSSGLYNDGWAGKGYIQAPPSVLGLVTLHHYPTR